MSARPFGYKKLRPRYNYPTKSTLKYKHFTFFDESFVVAQALLYCFAGGQSGPTESEVVDELQNGIRPVGNRFAFDICKFFSRGSAA